MLRIGGISYDAFGDKLYKPSYHYMVSEGTLAEVMGCTKDRLHRAVIRSRVETKRKPSSWNSQYYNLVYQGQLNLSASCIVKVLTDIASRRPYLPVAREMYHYLLEVNGHHKQHSLFNRQKTTQRILAVST